VVADRAPLVEAHKKVAAAPEAVERRAPEAAAQAAKDSGSAILWVGTVTVGRRAGPRLPAPAAARRLALRVSAAKTRPRDGRKKSVRVPPTHFGCGALCSPVASRP
jgi:hypothetical protein